MSGEENPGFLSRWSQRKVVARRTGAAPEPAEMEPAAPPELPELPALDTLDAASDFTVFLARGVPSAVQAQALRIAWASDPVIAEFRGMAEYAWDFNAPGYGDLAATDDVAALLSQIVRSSPRLLTALAGNEEGPAQVSDVVLPQPVPTIAVPAAEAGFVPAVNAGIAMAADASTPSTVETLVFPTVETLVVPTVETLVVPTVSAIPVTAMEPIAAGVVLAPLLVSGSAGPDADIARPLPLHSATSIETAASDRSRTSSPVGRAVAFPASGQAGSANVAAADSTGRTGSAPPAPSGARRHGGAVPT